MGSDGVVRYGVVGLGWFAQTAVLPAFRNARRNSRLVALFSSSPEKLAELGDRYEVEFRGATDDLENLLESGEIDALYVAVPNHQHRDLVERAAAAGVHVLCEKPMAVTAKDCEAMQRAAEEAGVKLMIAYRLHFEEANMKAVEIVRSGRIGEPRFFTAAFANCVADEDNIRLGPYAEGGGTLYDIGIYCLNAARYIFRENPVEVSAMSVEPGGRFSDCDEMTAAALRFASGRLATFTSSFGTADEDYYQVFGSEGDLLVRPAFGFHGCLGHVLKTGDTLQVQHFQRRDQVAPEILYFSDAVLADREPEPGAIEGGIDVAIIEALLEAARSGAIVSLPEFPSDRWPDLSQERCETPEPDVDLVEAEAPE